VILVLSCLTTLPRSRGPIGRSDGVQRFTREHMSGIHD
jgi:hypothetical protein